MLKITLFEKGGEDRVLYFEEAAVTLGRVQGNGIVLPKPNVSKRHAQIRWEGGVAVVEDMKSTNGTYVNGRRITTPRELGPDDRVHVGDFTLQVEHVDARPDAVSDAQPVAAPVERFRATQAMPAFQADESGPMVPPNVEEAPIELDVEVITDDEPSQVEPPPVFEPPRPAPTPAPTPAPEPPKPTPAPRPRAESVSALYEPPGGVRVSEGTSPGLRGQTSGLVRRVAPVAPGATEGAASEEYMAALRAVSEAAEQEVFAQVDPLRNEFGDEEWQALSDSLMRVVDRLRRDKRLPIDIDPFALTQDVLFEFTGLGPLEELLGDESIRAVMVDGLERIFVRRGSRVERLPKGFANEVTQRRVVLKLLALAGQVEVDSPSVEGRLPDGTFLQLINPPLSSEGRVIVLERPAATTLTLAEFLAANLLAQEAHDALIERIRRHDNIVVCGCTRAGQATFLNALLRALPQTDRVVLLEARREIAVTQANVVALNKGPLAGMAGGAAQVVHRLFPDLVVVPDLEPADVCVLTGLGLVGQRGLVASMVADSWRTCLRRLALMIQFQSPQLPQDTTERMVGQVVDCIVVLRAGDGGRSRVSQVVLLDRNGGEPRIIGDAE